MIGRKKLGAFLVSAVAFPLALALFFGRPSQAQSVPKPVAPWNVHAIESTFAGVRVREIDASNSAVVFLYDLANRTDSDYQLAKGPSVVIMRRLKSSGSLSSEKPAILASSAFVPAKNRTRIAVEIRQPFTWPGRMDAKSEDRLRQLVAGEVTDIQGFVLFDQSTRYQIDLPGAWPEIEKAAVPVDRR
jgi:hypothetical protein